MIISILALLVLAALFGLALRPGGLSLLLFRLVRWARKWTYWLFEVADEWEYQLERKRSGLPR